MIETFERRTRHRHRVGALQTTTIDDIVAAIVSTPLWGFLVTMARHRRGYGGSDEVRNCTEGYRCVGAGRHYGDHEHAQRP